MNNLKVRTPKEMADWLIKNRENPVEICNRDIESHKSVIKLYKSKEHYDRDEVKRVVKHNENQIEWWKEVKKIIENEITERKS